ncbi:helix-turn-helix transcriptional regulator [Saccharothrix sp. ALI-22-I]|uniref:helix-turn-helix transcriptional regulator n=1 Tax=Saccharothrix sp. ALI-22-I TaxID=1933778 RepID=UPI00117BD3D0|nr:helix-turn-helix transcriptional regulator [Saccharothrix sp. ALI-22-I]
MRVRSAQRVAEDVRRACRVAGGPVAVERAVVGPLRAAVPFDAWCVLTVDPATVMTTGGFHEEGLPAEHLGHLAEIEARGSDALALADLARGRGNAATLNGATGGRPERSERYRDILVPSGLAYEMRLLFRSGRAVWGAMVAFRGSDVADFSPAEIALAGQATTGVADIMRREMVLAEITHRPMPDGPGLVLVSGDLERVSCTEAAEQLLAEIDDGLDPRSGLPFSVVVLARRVLASGPVRSRLRTRRGRWLTLHADRTADQASIIVEPTRPVEVAAIVADAYGLTRRERTVVRLLACGHSRHEIARGLAVSPHTVDDHIKHVYAKLGARSRAELTYRLFFDQYVPRIQDQVPLGRTGWFLD